MKTEITFLKSGKIKSVSAQEADILVKLKVAKINQSELENIKYPAKPKPEIAYQRRDMVAEKPAEYETKPVKTRRKKDIEE